MSRRNWLLSGASIIVILAAGVVIFTRGSAKAQFPEGYVVHAVDLETKDELEIHASNKERPPFVNPKTGQRTMYPWYFCLECQHRFVPALVPSASGGPPVLPMIPACPKCGQSGTPWAPEDPDQAQPKGDAPLPKLP